MTAFTDSEKKLWASRFNKETDPVGLRYSESLTIDRPMIQDDLWGNLAHVIMLGKTGIVGREHTSKILGSLLKLHEQWSKGEWDITSDDEDVQMNVERYVIKDVGMESGGRMHTTRSRNDQVPLDTKLYTRRRILDVQDKLLATISVLLKRSEDHLDTYMPGYTHIQHAQPITFSYWLTSYASVLLRDFKRLKNAFEEVNSNPLGAGAISGTSFPIDRQLTSKLMAFDRVQVHGLDVVGARDWNLETLSALANMMTTTSRVAEEIIFWITYEFRMLTLDDSFGMGSSMMPQKRTPGF
jgi:argininosuccinate lyase